MHAVSISKWKPIALVNDENMYGAFNGIIMYFYVRVLFFSFAAIIFLLLCLLVWYNYLLIRSN